MSDSFPPGTMIAALPLGAERLSETMLAALPCLRQGTEEAVGLVRALPHSVES